jgi:hypothetical protein
MPASAGVVVVVVAALRLRRGRAGTKIEARCSLMWRQATLPRDKSRLVQPDSVAGITETLARACRAGCGVVCG